MVNKAANHKHFIPHARLAFCKKLRRYKSAFLDEGCGLLRTVMEIHNTSDGNVVGRVGMPIVLVDVPDDRASPIALVDRSNAGAAVEDNVLV